MRAPASRRERDPTLAARSTRARCRSSSRLRLRGRQQRRRPASGAPASQLGAAPPPARAMPRRAGSGRQLGRSLQERGRRGDTAAELRALAPSAPARRRRLRRGRQPRGRDARPDGPDRRRDPSPRRGPGAPRGDRRRPAARYDSRADQRMPEAHDSAAELDQVLPTPPDPPIAGSIPSRSAARHNTFASPTGSTAAVRSSRCVSRTAAS